jgi:hypothetical protein
LQFAGEVLNNREGQWAEERYLAQQPVGTVPVWESVSVCVVP